MQQTAVDRIASIADGEARGLRPARPDDACSHRDHHHLAEIVIQREPGTGRIEARGAGHDRHDNAPRMAFTCGFINAHVLPYMEPAARAAVRGRYPIQLHDSYTYLARDDPRFAGRTPAEVSAAHAGALVFSRAAGDADAGGGACPVLFPDPYQMANYGGLLDRADAVRWERKIPRMFFAGKTTGARLPERNARIKAALWSLAHRDVSDFYVTGLVQMQMEDAEVMRRVPALASGALRPLLPSDAHTAYRIALGLPGNTCSWSRVPAVLASRTVLFNARQPDVSWYSAALRAGTHFVEVDLGGDGSDGGFRDEQLRREYGRFVADRAACAAVADAANAAVREYCLAPHAALYIRHLFEEASRLHAA